MNKENVMKVEGIFAPYQPSGVVKDAAYIKSINENFEPFSVMSWAFSLKRQDLVSKRIDDTDIIATYLNAFPVERRQQSNCVCCLKWLATFGKLLVLTTEGTGISILRMMTKDADIVTRNTMEYKALMAVADLVETAIGGVDLYIVKSSDFGTKHPNPFMHFGSNPTDVWDFYEAQAQRERRDRNHTHFINSVKNWKLDDLRKWEHTLSNDPLVSTRSDMIQNFREHITLRERHNEVDNQNSNLFIHAIAAHSKSGAVSFRDTAMGELVGTLISGMDYDHATRAFLSRTAGDKYMRSEKEAKDGLLEEAMAYFEKHDYDEQLEFRAVHKTEAIALLNPEYQFSAVVAQQATKARGLASIKEARGEVEAATNEHIPTRDMSVPMFVNDFLKTQEIIRVSHIVNLNAYKHFFSIGFRQVNPQPNNSILTAVRNGFSDYTGLALFEDTMMGRNYNLINRFGVVNNQELPIAAIGGAFFTQSKEGRGKGESDLITLHIGEKLKSEGTFKIPNPLFEARLIPELHKYRSVIAEYNRNNMFEFTPGMEIHGVYQIGEGESFGNTPFKMKVTYIVEGHERQIIINLTGWEKPFTQPDDFLIS